jgi:phage I-like protein
MYKTDITTVISESTPGEQDSVRAEACQVAMTDQGPRLAMRLSGAAGLVRLPLAILGRWVKGGQKFAVTRQTMSDIVANFRRRKADTVIDYEHASEFPEAAQGQPIPAAGWLKEIDDGPGADGVLYGLAEFTPRAQELVRNREIKYVSPVIDWGARDKVTGEAQGATLTSLALTNRPFLEALPALALSERRSQKPEVRSQNAGWQLDHDAAESGAAGFSLRIRKEKRTVKVILADRGARTVRVVSDDNTESTLMVEGLEAPPTVVRLSDLKRGNDGRYDFGSVPRDSDALIAGEVLRGMEAQSAVDSAVREGKITPAQRPFYERMALSDPDGFRQVAATMKPQVDLREHGTGADGSKLETPREVQLAIDAAVAAKQKDHPKLNYGHALKLVASENPTLIRRWNELQKGGPR